MRKAGWMQQLSHMRLDRKITVFLFVTVLLTALALLLATSVSAARSVTQKSSRMAVNQIESVSRSLEMTLSEYRNLIMILMLDDRIQSYLTMDPADAQRNTAITNGAYQSVRYVRNVNSSIRYMAVLRDEFTEPFLYNGMNIYTNAPSAEQLYMEYRKSRPTGLGTLRYDVVAPRGEEQETLVFRLYQPLYATNHLDREIGLLCIGIDESILRQYCNSGEGEMAFHIRLTDDGGTVIYDLEQAIIGTPDPFAHAAEGLTEHPQEGKMVVSRSLEKWNIRLIGSISTQEVLSDSYAAVSVLLLLIFIITVVILFATRAFVQKLYAPLRNLVDNMRQIATGDLHVSMSHENIGDDFQEIVSSFNSMVVRLGELVEQVKAEERRAEQIRFNALQSQIQPHFLYNTLECIHWQSASNGDREVSKMVKALATYYRICLSKGRDIIPLSQEIVHIQSYLTIQNMRYDNIVETQFDIDQRFSQVQIPKMTLQPLIENSIYHGIKNSPGQHGKITVGAWEQGDQVVVYVEDNGAGMSDEEILETNQSIGEDDESFGYGVRNVHRRIEILFGKGCGLFYRKNDSGGLTVEIRLPSGNPAGKEDEQTHV